MPVLRERGLLLTNMQRVAGPVMAEHVVAMMMAFARALQFYIPERAAARWSEELPPSVKMITLEGKTVLVVGLGGIGTEVARRAHALGMRVTATRASGREGPDFVSYVGLPDELHKLAAEADFIVNTTPLTRGDDGPLQCGVLRGGETGRVLLQRRPRRQRRGGRPRRGAQGRPPGGRGARRDRSRAVARHEPALEDAERDHHAARFRRDSDLGLDTRLAIVRENLRRYVAGERMLSEVDLGKGY